VFAPIYIERHAIIPAAGDRSTSIKRQVKKTTCHFSYFSRRQITVRAVSSFRLAQSSKRCQNGWIVAMYDNLELLSDSPVSDRLVCLSVMKQRRNSSASVLFTELRGARNEPGELRRVSRSFRTISVALRLSLPPSLLSAFYIFPSSFSSLVTLFPSEARNLSGDA